MCCENHKKHTENILLQNVEFLYVPIYQACKFGDQQNFLKQTTVRP